MNLAGRGLGLLGALVLLLAGCGSGGSVEGAGYAYDVPAGWEDLSQDEIDEIFPLADSVVVGKEANGFATNVNVIAAGPVAPDTDFAAEVARGKALLREQPEIFGFPTTTKVEFTMKTTETTLAGEPAFEDEFTTDPGSEVLLQRQVTAVSPEGNAFVVTATSIDETADRDVAFDEVLETWSWE